MRALRRFGSGRDGRRCRGQRAAPLSRAKEILGAVLLDGPEHAGGHAAIEPGPPRLGNIGCDPSPSRFADATTSLGLGDCTERDESLRVVGVEHDAGARRQIDRLRSSCRSRNRSRRRAGLPVERSRSPRRPPSRPAWRRRFDCGGTSLPQGATSPRRAIRRSRSGATTQLLGRIAPSRPPKARSAPSPDTSRSSGRSAWRRRTNRPGPRWPASYIHRHGSSSPVPFRRALRAFFPARAGCPATRARSPGGIRWRCSRCRMPRFRRPDRAFRFDRSGWR